MSILRGVAFQNPAKTQATGIIAEAQRQDNQDNPHNPNPSWASGNSPLLAGWWQEYSSHAQEVFTLGDGPGVYDVAPIFLNTGYDTFRIAILDGSGGAQLAAWNPGGGGGDTGHGSDTYTDGGNTQRAITSAPDFSALAKTRVTFTGSTIAIVNGSDSDNFKSPLAAVLWQKVGSSSGSSATLIYTTMAGQSKEIRTGETAVGPRTVTLEAINADGTPKTGLTGKAELHWHGGAVAETTADISFVVDGLYEVVLTTGEVTQLVGTQGWVKILDGAGYRGFTSGLAIIAQGSFAEPLTSPVNANVVSMASDVITAAAVASSAASEIGAASGGGGGSVSPPTVTVTQH